MPKLTKAALEDLQTTYPLKGMPSVQRDQVIRVILSACAPDCLLPDYEIDSMIQKLARGDKFTDSYSYRQHEGAIMLQLPELYKLEQQIYTAEANLKQVAQALLDTAAENERIAQAEIVAHEAFQASTPIPLAEASDETL